MKTEYDRELQREIKTVKQRREISEVPFDYLCESWVPSQWNRTWLEKVNKSNCRFCWIILCVNDYEPDCRLCWILLCVSVINHGFGNTEQGIGKTIDVVGVYRIKTVMICQGILSVWIHWIIRWEFRNCWHNLAKNIIEQGNRAEVVTKGSCLVLNIEFG